MWRHRRQITSMVGGKWRLSKRTILEKYAALTAMDNGESQTSVTKRLGLPKTTISNSCTPEKSFLLKNHPKSTHNLAKNKK